MPAFLSGLFTKIDQTSQGAVENSCLLGLALEEVEDEAEAEDEKSHAEAIDKE